MEVVKQLEKALTAAEIENNRKQLAKDYIKFTEFANSEELQEYKELEDYVLSPQFEKDKKKIESLSYKGSTPWKQEKNYKKISKNKYLKSYLKLDGSSKLNTYNDFKTSETLKQFKEYEALVNSSSFDKKKNKQEFLKYKDLKKRQDIKEFHKFKFSKAYKHYRNVKDSSILDQYNDISGYLESADYKQEKEFLLNKKRFYTTEEYKKLEKYNQLKESEDIKRHEKYYGSNDFKLLHEWELTFEDDFSAGKLDKDKWISRYHNGADMLGESYSLAGDKHLFTDGSNLEFANNKLKIVTRKEKIVGKQWNGLLGFTEKEFDYTSGIINTGKSFRQKYGRFEAKVRISGNPLTHCFWLMSDYAVPHIDVFKSVSNKELVNAVFTDAEQGKVNKLNGFDFSKDFMIYTLIWEKDRIEWRINDVKVWERRDNIPHEPMYLSLGTCVYDQVEGSNAPSVMEVDWVKCYKKSE